MAAVLAFCSAFTLKEKEKAVYVFGIGASFNDTVVYCTPIQMLDSVELDKNGFLPSRELYSDQLKTRIESLYHKPNYTCMIYFSEKRSKLEKEAGRLLNSYRKAGSALQTIEPEAFTFTKPQ